MPSTMTTIPSAWEPHMGSSNTVDAQDYVERTALTPGSSTSTRPQPAPKLTSQAIANFPLRNTSDAARLLDRADPTESSQQETQSLRNPSSATSWLPSAETAADEAPTFFLTIEGLIDEASVTRLFQLYLTSIHPIMPLIPSRRMPATPIQIMSMAGREPFLMSAILVVTSGQSGEQALHRRIWGRTQTFFGEVALLGANVTIDSIEGLLLLSGRLHQIRERCSTGRISADRESASGRRARGPYLLDDSGQCESRHLGSSLTAGCATRLPAGVGTAAHVGSRRRRAADCQQGSSIRRLDM